MLTTNLFQRLLAKDAVRSTWVLKFALVVIALTASISALRTAYNRGYLICANSPEYLDALGILSRHGDNRLLINDLHVQITVCLLICAFGLWLRRPIGLLVSLVAVTWISNIYFLWYRSTAAFMVEQEIPNFSLLQGPGKQHLVPLRGATWWDIVVLVLVIVLLIWLVKTLVTVLVRSRAGNSPNFQA